MTSDEQRFPEEQPQRPCSAISVTRIRRFSKLRLRAMLALARLPEHLDIGQGVDLFQVKYWTQLLDQPVLASGLVALPRGREPRGTVMWMNGTNVTRAEAPSMGRETGLLVSAAFAGAGFALLAPDYIGLGLSTDFHPYMHGPSTVSACVDFLKAIRDHSSEFGMPWKSMIGLVGFSQGAYSTCVVQRELELHAVADVNVVAAAAIAPPLNLAGYQIPYAIEGRAKSHSLYLSYLAHSYCLLYSQPLETLINDRQSPVVAALFDGQHSGEKIMSTLPHAPREIFRPEVVHELLGGGRSWFRDALVDNEAFQWAPNAPLRFYTGSADIDVTPEDAKTSAEEMRQRGGRVDLVDVGPVEHEQTVLHAVPNILTWLRELIG